MFAVRRSTVARIVCFSFVIACLLGPRAAAQIPRSISRSARFFQTPRPCIWIFINTRNFHRMRRVRRRNLPRGSGFRL